ncbi:hypothetical protein ANO14919_029280 [Xylariales sp. No.14919]|nr:hypothetical protein ANO14919_029280 [Xylariales sp. No.14919]
MQTEHGSDMRRWCCEDRETRHAFARPRRNRTPKTPKCHPDASKHGSNRSPLARRRDIAHNRRLSSEAEQHSSV